MISVTNRLGVAAAGLIMLLASIGRADTITKWTFDSSSTAPAVGSGTANYVGGTALSGWVSGYSNSKAWSTTTYPALGMNPKTAGVRFDVNTTGYTNITVNFVWQASNTGSSNGVFQFSTDGFSSWTEWPSLSSGPGISTWKSLNFDLSTNYATAGCAGFCFRFVSAFAAGGSTYTAASGGSYGTSGTWKFDEVMVSGTLQTTLNLAITTPPSNALTVVNALTSYDLAGTSSNLVGNFAWANALTASAGTLPASATWSINGMALGVGANTLTVSGTNAAGNGASATVTITRQAPPALVVTAPTATFWAVDADTTNTTLAGTSSSLSGSIQWTNALTGAAGTVAGAAAWSIAGLALATGTNTITVSANSGSLSASVQLVRLPAAAWLKSGDIALIGWDDTQNSNRFSFVTLATIPAGSVIYFTDNGWSNAVFRNTQNTGSGNEDLLKFLAVQTLPAGMVVRTVDTGAAFEWLRNETIPGSSAKFTDLTLSSSGGDQVYAFQSSSIKPLGSPTVQLFLLDDSGGFEDATDVYTGNIPPGLVAGKTAIAFPWPGSASQHVMVFTNFDGRARNKMAWLTCIANSNNWFFGASGDQPTGTITVAPPPLLTVQPYPVNAGTATGGGQYDTADLVTLTATPLRGWAFARWSDGNTNANRTLSMSASDTTITAFFMWPSSLLLLR